MAIMTPPRILLFGRDGQVGWQLQRSLSPLGDVLFLGRDQCDLTDPDAVRRTVREARPDIIVNAAAYTAVDRAETEPELARRINADAVAVMAGEAAALNALLVHYSTDYVFDGCQAEPYRETDVPNPQSVYGQTKLAGELAIRESGARALILRVSWVFGARGANFVKTILRLAAERDHLRVVADQIGSPTPAAFISDATGLILAASRRGEAIQGTELYHLTAANPVSWRGFARAIVEVAQRTPGFDLRIGPDDIEAITTAEYPTPARRPANSRLDTSRVQADFGLHMPDWHPYLCRMMQLLALKKANGY